VLAWTPDLKLGASQNKLVAIALAACACAAEAEWLGLVAFDFSYPFQIRD